MLARKRVYNGKRQLLDVVLVDAALYLFHQHGVVLGNVEYKILLLVGEQAGHHIVRRNIRARCDADKQHHAGNVGGEVQLARLGVNIARQNIVQHHVLDEIRLVELLVMVLLDVLQADGKKRRITPRRFVRALHQHSVVVAFVGSEQMIGEAVAHEAVARGQPLGCNAVAHLSNAVEVCARDDGARLVHNTCHAVDGILHLINHALKHSVRHR